MDCLSPQSSLLLVVDIQEKLAAAMPAESIERLSKNVRLLLDGAAILGVPIVASEQYPKGLGKTLPVIQAILSAHAVPTFEKLDFDAASDPRISVDIGHHSPRSVVVVGMESHVCVFQTSRELVRRGYAVHVVSDAVASRTEENRKAGLKLAERAGAILTVAETVVFDWVGRAGSDAFRAVSKLVR